jgi:predicted unusual protein kinase regulating ubiquinone biosynthesis (AarF/ABC1/UbiB family)
MRLAFCAPLLRRAALTADPHPGNIGVDAGIPGGRLVYYDFGMMDEISGDLKARPLLLKITHSVGSRQC